MYSVLSGRKSGPQKWSLKLVQYGPCAVCTDMGRVPMRHVLRPLDKGSAETFQVLHDISRVCDILFEY